VARVRRVEGGWGARMKRRLLDFERTVPTDGCTYSMKTTIHNIIYDTHISIIIL